MTVPPSSTTRADAARLLAGLGLVMPTIPANADAVPPTAPDALDEATGVDLALRAEGVWHALGEGLSAWCGPFAYYALLSRSLDSARVLHPVLSAASVGAPAAPVMSGWAAVAGAGGPAAVVHGSVALLATLLDLLGRVIGPELAVNTVSDALRAAPSAPPRPATDEGHPGS